MQVGNRPVPGPAAACFSAPAASTRDRQAMAPTGVYDGPPSTNWLAFLSASGIHPKLSVSNPGDADEREADAVADRVMRMAAPAAAPVAVGSAGSGLARACAACSQDDEDARIARKARAPGVAPGTAQSAAEAVSGGGHPLDPGTRAWFEPRFGHDLSEVRIHTGMAAQNAATGIGARAYTHGAEIAFAQGQYSPGTEAGRRLLAHELVHTLQQDTSGVRLRRKPNLADCMSQTDDILPPHVGLLAVINREQELATKLGADYEPLKQLIKLRTDAREVVCNHGVPGVLALASTKTPQGVLDVPAAKANLTVTPNPAAPMPAPEPGTVPGAGAGDFKIDREETSSESRIFFARGSSALDAGDQASIGIVKAAKPASVRLLAYASADEPATLAQNRADSVKTALAASPDPVSVSSATGDAAVTASRSDYTAVRSVEILVGGATATTLDCAKLDPRTGALVNPPKKPCSAMDPPTWTAFEAAHIIAKVAMAKAEAAVAGSPSVGNVALIDRFFGGHDAATLTTLQANLGKLSSHVTNLPAETDCGNICDADGCGKGAIAYNNGQVEAASRMTLCVPTFKALGAENDRARNLIHETAHGTAPLGGTPSSGTKDVAYRHERLIFELAPADRLRNSDSYALFAMFVRETSIKGDPKAEPGGIKKPENDILPYGDKEPEKPALRLAIAKLEKRLTWCETDLGQLQGQIVKVRTGSQSDLALWAKALLAEAAKHFPLSDPATTLTLDDETRVAAILERYVRMRETVNTDLSIARLPSGAVVWDPSASVASPWQAKSKLGIGPDFFRATTDDQISLLLEQLAKATKGVEAAFVPAYVALAKWIHAKNP